MKIITHPSNIKLLKEQIKKSNFTENYFGLPNNSIHLIGGLGGIEILGSEHLEPEKWTGRWIRTDKMPDNRFVEMVDLKNPSEWAIYFGLVRKEMAMLAYEVGNFMPLKIDFLNNLKRG